VVIDLYKSGSYLRTIASNAPSSGAFQWQVPLDLTPGNDYAIRITSATNSALFDVSDAYFSIDAPWINPGSLTRLPDGSFSFSLTAYGSTQALVYASADFSSWSNIASVPLSNGVATFTDNTSSNLPARFYRLRLP
jgi:hypothetical protein